MRPIVRIVRMIAGLGAWTMWVPPLLLFAWAAMYLWVVIEYASAPGVPVAFEYDGPKGKVRVRAESYALDVGSKRAVARGLEVESLSGGRVIYVAGATLEQDQLGVTRVEAHDIEVILERMPDGEFTFRDVIPQSAEASGPEASMQVEAHNVQFRYLDRTRGLVSLRGSATRMVAHGQGAGWLTSGTVRFDNIGVIPLTVLIGPDNLFEADLSLVDTESAPIFPVIERYLGKDERLPFIARSARIDGKLQFVGAAGSTMSVYGSAKIRAEDLVIKDFRGDSLSAHLRFFGERASGRLGARGSGLELNAPQFAFDWADGPKIYAEGDARLVRLAALPQKWRRGTSPRLTVNGATFVGNFGWQANHWLANGEAKARQVIYDGEIVSGAKILIAASERSIVGQIKDAQWNGVSMRGAFDFSTQTGAVNAFVESNSVNLGPLARRYNVPLAGQGNLRAVVSSPRGRSQLWISSAGTASYRLDNGQALVGKYEARLSGTPQKVLVDRAILQGAQGTLAATGSIALDRKLVNLTVFGGQLQTATFMPDTKGEAFLSGRVTGSFKHPQFNSVVDVHELVIGDTKLPWLQLKASGNRSKITLSDIQGRYGFSRIAGNVTYEPNTGKLDGRFNSPGIQLAEFGKGDAAGMVRVIDGRVAGTLQRPLISASVEGGTISYSGATLAGLSAQLSASNNFIKILHGKVEVSDGDKTGGLDFGGQYSLARKSGELEVTWNSLPLRPLAQFDERFAVQGESTGLAKFVLNEKGPVSGMASGSLSDVALNGELVGSGPFQAQVENGQWVASGSIGSLERFASLDELKSDQQGNLTGKLTSYKVRAEALIRLTRAQWKETPEDVQRFVAGLTGEVDGTLAFSNINNQFRLQTDDLKVAGLAVGGRNVGSLAASVFREGPAWQLAKVELNNGDERISGRGSLLDNGEMNFEGEANKVSLSWLNAINPDLSVIPATGDASFILSGTSDNPHLLASLQVEGVLRGDAEIQSLPPSLNLDQIELKDNIVTAGGAFQAQGFTGTLAFNGPLASLMPAPKEGRNPQDHFVLEANVAERQISEFKDLLTFIDQSRSSGSMGGRLGATGTIDDVKLAGGFEFSGKESKLAFSGVKTELVNPTLAITLRGDQLVFEAHASGSQGGTLGAIASIPNTIPSGPLEEWLAATPVTGQIWMNGFSVKEGDASKANQLDGILTTVSKDTGKDEPITITGFLNSPLISGKVVVAGGEGDVPTLASAEPGAPPPVDPRFDLEFASVDPISMRTFSANLVASAAGSVKGSLRRPQADGAFFVEGGTLKLPNARIKLEDGGFVNFLMQTGAGGTTTVEVPVSLTGRTSVSARGPNSGYQRYDIEIQVNGDLMQQGDLQLIGRSDPNDLTQEQILAIIGQRDLLEALATGTQGAGSREFTDALIGLLLPTLSDQLTSELANTLNLDYISLDYNPFEGALLGAAKSFNKYVTLEARRALTEQRFVDAIRYELRLVYRIPTSNPLLSRSRFVLSTSNRAVWRLAIEYSTKF